MHNTAEKSEIGSEIHCSCLQKLSCSFHVKAKIAFPLLHRTYSGNMWIIVNLL